jgi:hypothetical protein
MIKSRRFPKKIQRFWHRVSRQNRQSEKTNETSYLLNARSTQDKMHERDKNCVIYIIFAVIRDFT